MKTRALAKTAFIPVGHHRLPNDVINKRKLVCHESCANGRARWLTVVVALHVALALCGGTTAMAAPPDLTAGGVPADAVTINLGPTGLRCWVYHVKTNTGESRQIQVKVVGVGSPADGLLAADDVILGANGTGANPVNFTADARKSLALAIADAEARNPATLKLIRWRAGATDTVALTLRTMGAYSATAPYNCPKSSKILEDGLQSIMTSETAGRYSFGTLSLLAGNNPSNPNNAARRARAQTEARALIPTVAEMTQMKSNVRDTASTWQRGHTLIVLAEYYLVTGDAQILPAIEAYALNVAKNQSMFGTLGHIYAEKNSDGSNNGPMGGVYGPVNSTGMPCFLGLLLAKECGLTNPEIAPAIERTSRFFAYYAGLGAVPYGEHEAFWQGHENNGKSGLAALAFELQSNRAVEQKFFAKMSTASTSERDSGHTGSFFNYLWAPLGAACGGEEAGAAHFSRIRWILDLARRWDGAFDYDTLNGDGPSSGSQYNDFRMSTAALLLYSLPLRQLHLTGRGHDPARWLSSADVTEAGFSDDYNAPSRTTSQLVTDLGNWSPKIQHLAADELAKRTTETTALLPTLHALANDPNGTSRTGACFALGKIANASSASVLAALLTDPQNHVRYAAAEGLRYLSTSAKLGQLNTILSAAASTATPLLPYNEEDPLHFAHAKIAQLLFYSGTAYGPKGCIWGTGINGVDRNYLYPAIRAVAANPIGFARSSLNQTYKNLTAADVTALADTLVDSVRYRAPADKMFGAGIRQGGIEILQANGISEGVPLSMIFDKNDGRGSTTSDVLGVLQNYAGRSTTVVPDPDVIGYLNNLLGGSNAAEAQAVLDAIAANPNPPPLTPFKSIQSVTADSPALNLPSTNTMLHVASTDHANGDSVYTWRKVHGAGTVSFTPNGTNDSRNAALLFDGIPGKYLFEVTMSDSRGLTEVSARVPVTLYNPGGTLPPNNPPTANSQVVTLVQDTPTPVTLGASDPEGYALVFRVTTQPAHGRLSGAVPNLIYTPEIFYRGADSFTFEVMDSEGQVNSATVSLIVTPAPNLYWDGNDITANADGGNGIWDNATNNWDDANTGGSNANWNNTNNYTAIFGGAAGTVTLGTSVTVGGLQFITTGYSIAPGAGPYVITFGTPGDINVTTGTSTISAVLAGSGTISKTGGGILVLAATNTFTGNTAITGGTLQIGSNGSVGTLGPATYAGNISIASGAKLLINNDSNQTFSGYISGDGTLQKGGGGTLILSGANTYTGKTTIATPGAGGPTLSVSSFNSVNGGNPLLTSSSLGAPTTVANGTIDLGSSGNTRSCTLIYTGSGETTDRVMNVSFNSSSKQTITASTSGLLKFTSAFTIVPSSGGLTTSGLYLRGSGNGELAGGMANAGTVNILPGFLEKADAGTWTIGGAFNIKGTTTVSGGTLSLQKQESLYNNDQAKWTPTNVTINSGTTLALGVGDPASGYFDSTALNAFLDSSHMGLSTATTGFKSGAILGFDTTYATAGTFTYSSVIGNLGTAASTGVAKIGAGTLVLDQANTFTGTTSVRAGKLFINGNSSAATGNVSVSGNATVGGTGIIGGATTIAANGKLEFNLSTAPASHDKLELAAVKTLTFSGASTLIISSTSGATTGTYTLLTAPGGITGSAPATLNLPAGWAATVAKVGNDLVLNVTSTGVVTDPYAVWAVGGVAFDADTNGDGVKNGLAWLLGAANPSANALNKLPLASRNGGNLRLTFRCLKSTKRGTAQLKVQSSSDLGASDPWTSHEAPVPDADGTVNTVIFDTTDDGDFINVIADIPAAGTKLFGRLHSTGN